MKTRVSGAFASLALCLLVLGAAPQEKKKQILFFTKSAGFEHDQIKKKGDEPSAAEKVLRELAHKNNWEITETKDGGIFTRETASRPSATRTTPTCSCSAASSSATASSRRRA